MIEGQGLHTGALSSVRFEAEDGPLTFVQGGSAAPLSELDIVDTSRSTTLASRDGRIRIRTVEHALAALAGLGVRDGVRVVVDGPEIPLADGCAARFFDAIAALGRPAARPSLFVARAGSVTIGESHYRFEPDEEPRIEVTIDFGDPRIAEGARWNGDARSFREEIAAARTFGFAHEVEALAARGLASHVAPESVVVLAKDAILFAGRPFSRDEPARHKLLDLAGDLYVHGGPPRGALFAHRPGHAATREVIRRALDLGLLDRLHRRS